jgi:uncharacterized protein YutE (UPF0331/DUF86 family)
MDKAERLRAEYRSVEKELKVLSMINAKRAQRQLDEIEIRGAALSLASLYNGLERILVTILTIRNEEIPRDEMWHAKLLAKASSLGIISGETEKELKGYLGFRHFVRHAYTFEIDTKTIEAILDKVSELARVFIAETRVQ